MTLKKPRYSYVARTEKNYWGITDDRILLNFIAQYVKFVQIDEEKVGAISLSEIIKINKKR